LRHFQTFLVTQRQQWATTSWPASRMARAAAGVRCIAAVRFDTEARLKITDGLTEAALRLEKQIEDLDAA